jgi:hypothetical protein
MINKEKEFMRTKPVSTKTGTGILQQKKKIDTILRIQ